MSAWTRRRCTWRQFCPAAQKAPLTQAAGFHGWLWALRLAAARAEIALAQGKAEEALHWSDEAIAQCRVRGRVKYEVLGLVTRGKALSAAGRASEAIADLRRAVVLARPIGDPALLLRAIGCLLPLDGEDALAVEGTATIGRIVDALPDADERRQFETAEPQQALRLHLRSALKASPV